MTAPQGRTAFISLGAAVLLCVPCALRGETHSPPAPRAASAPAATQPTTAPAGATFKAAAIQFVSKLGATAENRAGLEVLIRRAAAGGAKIVVLPETAITGYMSTDHKTAWRLPGWPITPGLSGLHPGKFAETVPGPSTEVFARLAKELGIYLTVPLVEVDPGRGHYFNTVVLAGPDGRLLLHYRKLNPWPFAEKGWATPGDRGHQHVDTPCGRLSLLICYDIHFEPQRLKKAKIDTLLYCIAWVDAPGSRWFDSNLPDIARGSDMNIIAANWTVEREQTWSGYGKSRIISRDGRVLAKARRDVGEEIIYADLPIPGARPPGDAQRAEKERVGSLFHSFLRDVCVSAAHLRRREGTPNQYSPVSRAVSM